MSSMRSPTRDEPLSPDQVADRLAEVYLVVGPLYRRALSRVERDTSTQGLSAGMRMVLDLLRRGGAMTVPQLAAAQSLSRQFVQRMVNECAEADLVESTPNPAHRRSSLIRLTDAGRRRIEDLVAREHVELSSVGGGTLTAADVDSCLRVLTAMLDVLEQPED